MNARTRHLALLRQPWQARRQDTGWNRAWVGPLVCGLGVLALVLAWPKLSHLWLGAQAIGLARQPFEIAMLAIVNQRMGLEAVAEPEIEGEVTMGRHESRIMVSGLGINIVAAGRLDADGHVAEGEHRKMKGAIAEEGIGLRNVPARGDLFTDGIWQLDEIFLVFRQAQLHVVGWK